MNSSSMIVVKNLCSSIDNPDAGGLSSKCASIKNATPFSITLVDKQLSSNTTTKAATDNIATDNINSNFSSEHLQGVRGTSLDPARDGLAGRFAIINRHSAIVNRQSPTVGTPGSGNPLQSVRGNENGDKGKAKTKDLTAKTLPAKNIQHFALNQEPSTANILLGNNITLGINNSYQQKIRPKVDWSIHTQRGTGDEGRGLAGTSVAPIDERRARVPASPSQAGSRERGPSQSIEQTILTDEKQATSGTITGPGGKKSPPLLSSDRKTRGDFGFQPSYAKDESVQGKPLNTEQKAPISPRKSPFDAEKSSGSEQFTKKTNNDASDGKTLTKFHDINKKEPSDNHISSSIIQKFNITEFHVGANQTKDRVNSTSDNRTNQDLSTTFFANNIQSLVSEQPPVAPKVTNITNPQGQTSLSSIYSSISEQIIESIRASLQQADKLITVRLDPPELGNIFIRLQEQKDEITGFLEVSKAEIKYEIEQTLPQIIRILSDCGVQIKRLEVQLSEQFEPHADRNYAGDGLGDNSFQHHRFAEGGNSEGSREAGTHENGTEEWLVNIHTNSYQDHYEPELILTNESLNMLI